jgi:hypothetical protein
MTGDLPKPMPAELHLSAHTLDAIACEIAVLAEPQGAAR